MIDSRYADLGSCDYCGEGVDIPYLVSVEELNGEEISCPTCEAAGVMYTNGFDCWAYWY